MDNLEAQAKVMKVLKAEKENGYPSLRGKNLACWCRIGTPCHADLLLGIANRTRNKLFDLDAALASYGYRFERGRPYKITEAA